MLLLFLRDLRGLGVESFLPVPALEGDCFWSLAPEVAGVSAGRALGRPAYFPNGAGRKGS